MMTKSDHEAIGLALKLSLTLSQRIKVYRKMVPLLAARDSTFDPVKFGKGAGIPKLFCTQELAKIRH